MYEVGVLIKAIDVLEALAWSGSMGLTELTAATKANKASVFRILSTLESRGLVVKDAESRKYSPGPNLLALASAITEGTDLVQVAQPIVNRVRDELGETVNLATLVDDYVQYVYVAESTRQLRMALSAGTTDDLHSTALGKTLLSRTDAREVRKLLKTRGMPARTPNTITTEAAFLAHLEEVRQQGYATDVEEREEGAYCVAVPIESRDGGVLAAISLSSPKARLSLDEVANVVQVLRAAAREIARNVGH